MEVCIASDGRVATQAAEYVRSNFPEHRIVVLPGRPGRANRAFDDDDSHEDNRNSGVQLVSEGWARENEDLLLIFFNNTFEGGSKGFKSKRIYKIHFSLLPKYRGHHTSSWPIINGDLESGTTLCVVDSGIDSGDIISQSSFYIYDTYTAADLLKCHIDCALSLFKSNLASLIAGNFFSKRQSPVGATFFGKDSLNLQQPAINYYATAHQVSCQIRGHIVSTKHPPTLLGTPICGVEILNKHSTSSPGEIIASSSDFLDLATVDYNVRLLKMVCKSQGKH